MASMNEEWTCLESHEGLHRPPGHHRDHHDGEYGDGGSGHVHHEDIHRQTLHGLQCQIPSAFTKQMLLLFALLATGGGVGVRGRDRAAETGRRELAANA